MEKPLFYTKILSADAIMFTLPRKVDLDLAQAGYELARAALEFDIAQFQKKSFEKYKDLWGNFTSALNKLKHTSMMTTPRKYMESLLPEERELIMGRRGSEAAQAEERVLRAQAAIDKFLHEYNEVLANFNSGLSELSHSYAREAAEIEAAASKKRSRSAGGGGPPSGGGGLGGFGPPSGGGGLGGFGPGSGVGGLGRFPTPEETIARLRFPTPEETIARLPSDQRRAFLAQHPDLAQEFLAQHPDLAQEFLAQHEEDDDRTSNPGYGYNYEEDPYDDLSGGFGYARMTNPGHRHHRRGYGR